MTVEQRPPPIEQRPDLAACLRGEQQWSAREPFRPPRLLAPRLPDATGRTRSAVAAPPVAEKPLARPGSTSPTWRFGQQPGHCPRPATTLASHVFRLPPQIIARLRHCPVASSRRRRGCAATPLFSSCCGRPCRAAPGDGGHAHRRRCCLAPPATRRRRHTALAQPEREPPQCGGHPATAGRAGPRPGATSARPRRRERPHAAPHLCLVLPARTAR